MNSKSSGDERFSLRPKVLDIFGVMVVSYYELFV